MRSDYDLEVRHRACRLKAAFPGQYTERGDGLVSFDLSGIERQVWPHKRSIITRSGLIISCDEPTKDDVVFEVRVKVGNSLSGWSWHIAPEEWQGIMDWFKEHPE